MMFVNTPASSKSLNPNRHDEALQKLHIRVYRWIGFARRLYHNNNDELE